MALAHDSPVVVTSQMFAAPRITPAPIIDKVTTATREILARPQIVAKLREAGFQAQYEGPEQLRARVSREISVWNEIVERTALRK
jgi:tripartite-type tricarboxylate transporter receptor subunit TctC